MPKASLRDAIVDAALVEFHQHGYAATGVAAITGSAGAPKGSFYNHFRSKADLAMEVADRFAAASPIELLEDPSVPRAVDPALSATLGRAAHHPSSSTRPPRP
jgi:TetR/AcrR family transcriptional repressor of nem operon